MAYDPIKMRGAIRTAHQRNGRLKCAWCGGNVTDGFDPHHALVKRSASDSSVIHSPCNVVPLHRECHSEHGQGSEMVRRALDYVIASQGSRAVALWWIDLWAVHGLSVARGIVPASRETATEQEWREYLELVCLPL